MSGWSTVEEGFGGWAESVLEKVTLSKSAIESCTKTCIETPDGWSHIVSLVVIRMAQRSVEERLPLFYLVDSVLREAKRMKSPQLALFTKGAANNLPTLLGLAAPDGLDASSKVRKVVQNWKLKKVFDDLTISVAQATAGPHAAKLLAEHQPAQQTDATATVAVAPAVAVTEASPAADQDFPARVVALFDLKSGRPGELVLVAGVEYGVTAKLDANWYSGTDPAGASGMFPITYVKPIAPTIQSASATGPAPTSKSAQAPTAQSQPEISRATKRSRLDPNAEIYATQIDDSIRDRTRLYSPSLPSEPSPPSSPLAFGYRPFKIPQSTKPAWQQSKTKRVVTTKPTGSPDSPLVIHIFDLDETLIQFNSLLTGAFARETMQLAETAKAIGEAFEDVIISVTERMFFMLDLEFCNQPHVRAVEAKDDGLAIANCKFETDGFAARWRDGRPAEVDSEDWCKLARRCRAIEDRYTAAVRNVTAASEAVQQDGAPRPTHFTKYPLTQASTPKGLTFKAGRPVVVLRQEPTGWWWVSIDGAEGEAPANYLEEGGGANGSPIEHSPTAVELRALRDAGVLTDVQLGSLAMMHTDLEAYTNGWISATLRLLESLKMVPGAELVMVTNSELAPAMAKTLLFRLGKYFSAENIYSSATIGKRAGFDLIRARFGAACEFVAYGDGPEEESVSRAIGIPFHRITSRTELRQLTRRAERLLGHLSSD